MSRKRPMNRSRLVMCSAALLAAACNLNTACTYRIQFLVAGLQLGLADVDVVDNGVQLKRVDTDEFVPLLDDGTLAIKARVELGAVTFALTGDATACRPGRDCGEAVVTPVAGQDVTVLTTAQTAGLFIPAGALAEQVVVLIESRTDRPCIPLSRVALPGAAALGTPGSVGVSGSLRRGWHLVVNQLHALFGARAAYASTSVIHVGLGGSPCCTSYFTWGLPAVLSPNSASQFYQSPGGTVVPSIVVRDSGGTPITGAIVTFSVATENGTIIGTNPVTTGADGIAQVSWQLPSAAGTYNLTAVVPGAAESPLTFTATALFLTATLTDPTA